MTEIPKIIHQIWSGTEEPLPEHFRLFGETWKEYHPAWKYELWDKERMLNFITEHYPHYLDTYQSFQYNIQRYDAIRYLILDKIGGMYVDFDTECLRPHDELLAEKVSPFDMNEIQLIRRGYESMEFDSRLKDAYSVHYFWGTWWNFID
jgi:mannosyltransferase OCH1-like enzyme